MVDVWGGSWATSWGLSWAQSTEATVEAVTGGWVDLEEVKRRPKRQKKADERQAELMAELRRAYNAANGIVEDVPAEATEAVKKAVEDYSSQTEAQPLPKVDWQALAADMAAVEALTLALDMLARERQLEEEAVEMLLMSI